MANNKIGLSYYKTDTDRYQDIKIKRLKKDFGCSGIAVFDYILCEIYRVRGCFIAWDESTAFDVAEYFGIKESLVNEIVNYCGVVGLFDKGLLTRGSILTSLPIQKRYLEICINAKRSNIEIPKIAKIQEESHITQEVCPITQEESHITQEVCDKEKKSKVKKEKEEEKPETVFPMTFKNEVQKIDYKKLVELFHITCPAMPKVTDITDVRKKTIKARIAEHGETKVAEMLKKAGASKFLNGSNERSFIASFDWLFRPTNFIKVLEGNYKDRITANTKAGESTLHNNSQKYNW